MDREVTTMVSADVAHDLTSKVQATTTPALKSPLRGSVLVLIQYRCLRRDPSGRLRGLISSPQRQATFKSQAPGYVRYQRTPVAEPIEPVILQSGERLSGEIKYYDYGVVSIVFELPFAGDWENSSSFPPAGPPTRTSRSWPRASSGSSWNGPLPR